MEIPLVSYLIWCCCRYHGIVQVNKEAYESCDLQGGVVRQWAPPGQDGRVTIDLPSGQVYYFIDTVPGNCELGHKMNVSVCLSYIS